MRVVFFVFLSLFGFGFGLVVYKVLGFDVVWYIMVVKRMLDKNVVL